MKTALVRGLATRLFCTAGLAIVAAVAVPAPVAQAQTAQSFMRMMGGGMGMGRGGQIEPSYTSRDLDRAADVLGFDADQRTAGKAMLDAYQTSFQESAEKVRVAMERAREAMRDDGDRSAWDDVRKAGEALAAERTKLDTEFVSNLQAVCTDDQKARWPKYERLQRREQGLDRGSVLSGESVNLFTIVDKLELSSEAKATVTPLLDQYEVDLDQQLVARKKVQEEVTAEGQKMMQNFRGPQDLQSPEMMKKGNELLVKAREASVNVRNVNRRFATQIENALPSDKKETFLAEIKKQSFPDVYNATRVSRSLDAAIGFGDLTPEQKTQIEDLRTRYTGDLATANERMATATEKEELETTAEKMMDWRGNQDSPLGEARRKKRELGNTTEDALKKILNEEQVKRLPQGDDREGGRMRGAPGGGGGGPGAGAPGGGGGGDNGGRRPNRPRGNRTDNP